MEKSNLKYNIMAHLNNYKNNKYQPSMLQQIGQKVKMLRNSSRWQKGAWDIGRSVYETGRALAPIAGAVATAMI